MVLLYTVAATRLNSQGNNKYFENDSLAEHSFIDLLAGKEDTTAVFFRDFFANEFTFLNTTYHGSFELRGGVNKRGLRTGVWEIFRIAGHKRKMLLAKGRYLPLSPSRVIIDPLLLTGMPQPVKDSLKQQFWMETDFNAINFPEGTWHFFTFFAKITKEYQLNAKYIMASFGRASEKEGINLQPFDFFTLFDGVQREYDDNGRLTDSSVFTKYDGGVSFTFKPSSDSISKTNYYVFKHNMGMLTLLKNGESSKLDEKVGVGQSR
jgi:hypothetical protein